jgi:hypothetical protein
MALVYVGLMVLAVVLAAVPILMVGALLLVWAGVSVIELDWLASIFEKGFAAHRAHRNAIEAMGEKPEFTKVKRRGGLTVYIGEIDGREVVVDSILVSSGNSSRRVERIRMQCDDLPKDLVLHREGLGSDLWKMVAGTDEVLGDRDFDRRVVLRGSRGDVTARLNEEVRGIVREMLSKRISLEAGKLSFVLSGRYKSVQDLEEIIEQMRRAANALAGTGEPEEQLLYSNVCSDSDPEVRARNLGMLAMDHPESEALRLGLKAVLGEAVGHGGPLDQTQEAAFLELLAAPARGDSVVPLEQQVAAAIGLGLGASGAAVPFLRDWAGPFSQELFYAKRVAHLAVAAIQKRVGPVEGGALSLSAVPMGAVSVAEGQGGELSVAEEEERRKKQGAAAKKGRV